MVDRGSHRDSRGDQGSPDTTRSREIRLFHVWLTLAGKVNECNCTGTSPSFFFSPASFFSFSFVCFVSRPNFPRYCTPTLSLFSRTAIAALTYHRSHARRSNRGTQTRDPPFSLFSFLLYFLYFFLFCTFRSLVYSSATYGINFTYFTTSSRGNRVLFAHRIILRRLRKLEDL